MEAIKNYILTLSGFSFISSVICAFLPEIPAKKTVKFVCGIVLCVLITSPLKNLSTEISDIFSETESYNLYNGGKNVQTLTESVLSDKVSEVVGACFVEYGITDAETEVVFNENAAISAVNINKICEPAAKKAAQILGIPYELMHMTE